MTFIRTGRCDQGIVRGLLVCLAGDIAVGTHKDEGGDVPSRLVRMLPRLRRRVQGRRLGMQHRSAHARHLSGCQMEFKTCPSRRDACRQLVFEKGLI
mmetsp:Transcript_115312/g.372984  ORF Transcript_115312/g.372984 Transcript_115312/m.372984 type:complete len:97 (-) Transcript_115312:119-409(-)